MWLVSTLLNDYWFDDLEMALQFYQASAKTRTYPRLEARRHSLDGKVMTLN